MQVYADAGKTREVRAVTAFGHTAADLDGSLPPVSLSEPGSPGTYAGYDDFARRTADAPSAQTVRNEFRSWTAAKPEALTGWFSAAGAAA